MDFQTIVSKGLAEELKCAMCNNFLSYFPIHSCDKQNVCGRCILPQAKSSSRNNVYEVIAQLVKFPCRFRNEGCHEEMCPEEVPQHEKTCRYRLIKCPKTTCNWEGSQNCMLEHCNNEHSDSFIEDGEFNVHLTSNRGKCFLKHDNILFIVDCEMDSSRKFLKCAVYHLETDIKQYCFQLSLQNFNRSISIKLFATQFDEICVTDFCLDSLKSQSDDYPLVLPGKFTLSEIREDTDLSANLLRNCLTCSNCFEFVIPPIYQCFLKKVVLCGACQKNHIMYCTTCYDILNVTTNSEYLRNAGLEEMAKYFFYPCKNGKNGCTAFTKSTEMKQHLENCAFQELNCPLNEFVKCSRKDVMKNINLHIKNDHGDKVIMNNSEVSIKHFRVGDTNSWMIEFRKHWFRVVFFRSTSDHFCWIVQIVAPSKENFYYRIEIAGDSKNGPKQLMWTGPCSRLCKKTMLFPSSGNDYCMFFKDQIKQFSALTFTVSVFKVK